MLLLLSLMNTTGTSDRHTRPFTQEQQQYIHTTRCINFAWEFAGHDQDATHQGPIASHGFPCPFHPFQLIYLYLWFLYRQYFTSVGKTLFLYSYFSFELIWFSLDFSAFHWRVQNFERLHLARRCENRPAAFSWRAQVATATWSDCHYNARKLWRGPGRCCHYAIAAIK